jgi:hypothetical protein
MSDNISERGLLNVLRQLLPESTLSVIHQRPWHSLTFTGLQLRISATLSPPNRADIAERAARDLPDHEFDIRGQIVADIAVTGRIVTADATILTIDALLLED